MKKSVFALVDCNSFFCSCERLFRPQLKKTPVIVLSNNDGCVVSRTDEAKKLGIPMGAPYFKIKEFCRKNNVAVFSSNYALYGDLSHRVMKTLSEFSPEMEIYSIDEAFLSLTGFEEKRLKEYGQKISETVYRDVGIPVSVGIAPTKVLAKIANYWIKKNKIVTQGVMNLQSFTELELEDLLRKVPVEEVWGVGRKSTEKLQARQIRTAFDLQKASPHTVQKILTITGRRLQRELSRESCLPLELISEDKEQIISSRSFGRPVVTLELLKEAVASHVSNASERLRKQKSITRALSVFIQTNPFKQGPQYSNSSSVQIPSGSAVTPKLIRLAHQALERIFKEGYEYKKAGVIFMDIQKKDFSQLDFFGDHDSATEVQLMQTLDQVNQEEGRGILKYAACGIDPEWKMLSDMKSPNYSTRWRELLEVG